MRSSPEAARVAALRKFADALAVRVRRQDRAVKVLGPKPDEERRHGERRHVTATPHDDAHLEQLAQYTYWVIKSLGAARKRA
jgi:hypothetical protein